MRFSLVMMAISAMLVACNNDADHSGTTDSTTATVTTDSATIQMQDTTVQVNTDTLTTVTPDTTAR